MAEEHRCQEVHRLCANNCGFFGSPATLDLCSKCYRDFHLNEEQAASAKIAVEKSLLASASSSPPPSSSAEVVVCYDVAVGAAEETGDAKSEGPAEERQPENLGAPSRCAACRKRVGLTGFRCRCGDTYCGAHRYAEQHGCAFDFKAAGREAIARSNPVVKADKLGKI